MNACMCNSTCNGRVTCWRWRRWSRANLHSLILVTFNRSQIPRGRRLAGSAATHARPRGPTPTITCVALTSAARKSKGSRWPTLARSRARIGYTAELLGVGGAVASTVAGIGTPWGSTGRGHSRSGDRSGRDQECQLHLAHRPTFGRDLEARLSRPVRLMNTPIALRCRGGGRSGRGRRRRLRGHPRHGRQAASW
jgi:hypothetical protein